MNLDLETMSLLSTIYSEPHRKYHNITHIHHCLRELNAYINCIGKRKFRLEYGIHAQAILESLIWFHDAYYDPYAPKGFNEAQSFILFDKSIKKNIKSKDFYGFATDDILSWFPFEKAFLATSDHQIPELIVAAKYNDFVEKIVALFLDIDMSIFADYSLFDDYKKYYAMKVREEYYMTSDREFAQGRKEFLEQLLQRPIYHTKHYKENSEKLAKSNIAEEIESLNRVIKNGSYKGSGMPV